MAEAIIPTASLAPAGSAVAGLPGAGLPGELWAVDQVLVVVAHPDDESFGLGGVIAWLADHSVAVNLVCFTAGEASTVGGSAALGAVRAEELQAAAAVLGIREAWLEGMADGGLTGVERHAGW
jgi:LmbE family N-acetylglucosaminyl deacetylase